MEKTGEMGTGRDRGKFKAVVANLSDIGSLSEAFEGCRGVFHTCSFADPAGLSGYSVSTPICPFFKNLFGSFS